MLFYNPVQRGYKEEIIKNVMLEVAMLIYILSKWQIFQCNNWNSFYYNVYGKRLLLWFSVKQFIFILQTWFF